MTMPKDPQKIIAYKQKLSEAMKGRKFTDEHRKKLSDAKKINPVKFWEQGKRIQYDRRGHKQWMYDNKETDYNKSLRKRRLLELERIAGRKKPENCEICGKSGRICFDHNHKSGKFRGWICEHCNVLLGFAKDDIKTLRQLATYLENQSY